MYIKVCLDRIEKYNIYVYLKHLNIEMNYNTVELSSQQNFN